jgi:uncharacterized membrane protein YoaK (UPF0700 family)
MTGRDRRTLGCLLALTFSTGVADAVGYLGLDKVFTGNMTGNVVILGMGASGATDLPVVGPAVALLAFLAGAGVAGRCLRGTAAGWTGRTTALLAAVAAVFAATAGWWALVPVAPGTAAGHAVSALLAGAMGLQAAAARHVAVKDVTTVVVTSTITGLAADSWAAGRTGQPWVRRSAAVAVIGLGALAGALLVAVAPWTGVAASAALTAVTAAVAHRGVVRPVAVPAR